MNSKDLVAFFIEVGVITRGNFVGKAGTNYSIETDLRNAFLKYTSAKRAARLLYDYMRQYVDDDVAFLGVPETGTLISHYLNTTMYSECGRDFVPNMMRSVPKEYQQSTNSVFTVLPIDTTQKYVLVEDDVVTGGTLCKYLKSAVDAGLNIVGVVAVFGRDSATSVNDLCMEYGIPYFELINVKSIEGEV